MNFLKTLLILPVALVAFAAPALAQTNIAVFNEERVLRQSAVGQHIAARIGEIRNEIDAELTALGQPIQAEQEALEAETAALSPEAIQARPDLMSRIQTLNTNAREFEATRQRRQQELVATERQAMRPVLEALQEVLQEVVAEQGIHILVDRSNLVFATEDVDISPAVIERMNARLPTVPVNRVRLPEQAAAGQGQQ